MGKLGKKARKFAKKNLQSVLKRKRKLKSFFKKRDSKKDTLDDGEVQDGDAKELANGRENGGEDSGDISLDAMFSEDHSDVVEEDSDSDGYLLEDSSFSYNAENGSEDNLEEKDVSDLSVQNKEIYTELAEKLKRLQSLKKKDPEFLKYLESNNRSQEAVRSEDVYSDEDETSNDDSPKILDESRSSSLEGKLLTSFAVSLMCQEATEKHNVSALTCILNGYRAACRYGNDSTGILVDDSKPRIQNSETYCKLLMFTLCEVDNIFKELLGISSSKCKKETILELKNTSKWKDLKPLIKLYLRSTVFLLNQASDSEILAYALARIRASIAFFAAFPSLLYRLIKVAVHLWATGEETLSLHSFLVIKEVTSVFTSEFFGTCLAKTYKAFTGSCQSMDPDLSKRIQFLKDSFVQLCLLDVQQSTNKAAVSIQLLGKILQQGVRTKRKEAVKKICSWQYINCIDIWVAFISANSHDHDLQPLLLMMIQIINGVAQLFPGPRYLPIRLKCIRWLNNLSSSCGCFIPVASLVLDILEFKVGKVSGKPGKGIDLSSAVKLPKYWLKSRNFQEECVLSAIEQLSMHFAQWSCHITFPELAAIPLIRLRRFHKTTTIENFKQLIKRFIDQVEQNVEFVQKKRDEVAFSPKDQQSIETFLQLEKGGGNVPFIQYYKSITGKTVARKLIVQEKSGSEGKNRRKRAQQPTANVGDNVLGENSEKNEVNLSAGDQRGGNAAKRRKTRRG